MKPQGTRAFSGIIVKPLSTQPGVVLLLIFPVGLLAIFVAEVGIPIIVATYIVLFLVVFRLGMMEGMVLDLEGQRYLNYWGLFGLRFGSWEPLLPLTNVLLYGYVSRETTIPTGKSSWATTYLEQPLYKLSIFNTQTDFELLVHETTDEAEAYEQARALAELLQLELQTHIEV